MKNVLTVSFLVLGIALVAVPSSDAKGFPQQYVALKLGGFFPQSGDLDDINADAGANGEIALGHYVAPGFAIEGGIGYFETKSDLSGTDEKFQVVPVTVSLRGQVPYGRFEPYGLVGIGVYFVEDKISGSGSDRHTSLGFHVGLGGSYTLSEHAFLGVEARYLFLETSTFGVDFRLDGIALTGNVGYRF
jgi:opacity protein-like surface antigen